LVTTTTALGTGGMGFGTGAHVVQENAPQALHAGLMLDAALLLMLCGSRPYTANTATGKVNTPISWTHLYTSSRQCRNRPQRVSPAAATVLPGGLLLPRTTPAWAGSQAETCLQAAHWSWVSTPAAAAAAAAAALQ
jgi:hypothetical protein